MKKVYCILSLLFVGNLFAQSLNLPAKSPFSRVSQTVGLSEVMIEYARPSKKGRVVFGDLVPFNEVWRTGANSNTLITFGEDVMINKQNVKAGTYSLFTIPGEKSWSIMLNSNTSLWGTNGYKEEENIIKWTENSTSIADEVETFTINFNNLTQNTCTIELTWDKTKVSFAVEVAIDDKIMENIKSVMIDDKKPYHQAAQYYYDNKKDLKQALDWASKGAELNPKAYWTILLKAKIQAELKDKKGAKTTAELAKKVADEAGNKGYVKQAEELINSL